MEPTPPRGTYVGCLPPTPAGSWRAGRNAWRTLRSGRFARRSHPESNADLVNRSMRQSGQHANRANAEVVGSAIELSMSRSTGSRTATVVWRDHDPAEGAPQQRE